MGIDIFTLNKAKRYTNLVALGLASATVDDANKSITFTLAADGSQHTIHFNQPSDGQDGVSVTGISDKGNGVFTLLFSDGSESDPIQTVKGQKGDKGDKLTFNDLTDEEKASLKGSDGFSPSAKIEKVGDTATITITDKDGTTTATIKDGQGGSGGGTVDVPIEKIKVNGELQTPVNKVVDITVPSIEGLTKDADLSTVAKSGSYEDLINKPTIPDITGLATETYVDNKVADYTKTVDLADVATSGSYNDLADKPTIPSLDGYAKTSEIPSKVSELENDSNYLSSIPEEYVTDTELEAKGYLTEHQDISGKVDKVEGKSLISDTEIARLATVDNYDDTDIKAEIAKKADTTSIPSKVSELTNDSNYQTAEQVNSTVTTEIAKVVADAPESLNTLKEMSDWIAGHENDASAMNSAIKNNQSAITTLQTGKADKSEIPTTVAELTDSADYAKTADVNNSISTLQTDKADASDLTAHTGDNVIHVTAENKTLWNTVSNKVNKEDGKALLADTDKTNYDDAVTKAHTHENKEVLDGITSDKVASWDNKSEFSGSYNDLNDKPTIDAELSNTSENAIQNKVVTKEINKLYSDISFNDFDTATDGISFTDAEDGNMIVTDWTRNLLNPTLETTTQNGVTCTNNGDGTYTINGTSTKDSWISFGGITLNPGKYKFIATENNVRVNNLCVALNSISIAMPGDMFIIQSKCVCDIGLSTRDKTFNNVLIKLMITTDLSATYDDFVPYSGYDIKTCGKNLLNPTLETTTQNGVTCTNNGDGTYTFNGTSTADGVFFDFNKNIAINKGTEYKVVCFKDEDYIPNKILSCVRRVDMAVDYVTGNGSFVSDTENCWMWVSIAKGVTVSNLVAKPMITTNLSATYDDFVQYQDGGTVHIDSTTEFPLLGLKSFDGITNIISPANVKCVYPTNESGKGVMDSLYNKDKILTEQNKSLSVIGKCKNLLNPTLETTTVNGVTCTNNGDGTYTLNGTASRTTWFEIVVDAYIETEKTYKLLGTPSGGSEKARLQLLNKIGGQVLVTDVNKGALFTSEVPKFSIQLRIENGTNVSDLIFKPMLTTDLSATYDDFVPYTGDGETLTHDVAEIKNDLGGMVTKQGHFGSNKTDFTLENLYEGFQQFMITTLYRATGEPNDCDGYIIIHKESSSGIKSFKVYGASGVTVSYDSSSNKITLTTTKPYMSLYVTSNKNFDIV